MSLSFPYLSTRKSLIDPFRKQAALFCLWRRFHCQQVSVTHQLHFGSLWAVSGDGRGRVKWGDWVCCRWLAGKSSSRKFSSERPERGVSTDRVTEDIIHRKQSVLVSVDVIMCLLSLEAFSTVGRVGSRSCSWNCILPPPLEWCSNWRVGSGRKASQRWFVTLAWGSDTDKNLAPNTSDPCYIFLHKFQRKELEIPPFLSVLVSTCCFSFSSHFSCSSCSF